MGFDNAHAVKSRKRAKFKGRIVAYDHQHKSAVDKGSPYVFSDPQQLLTDFFVELNRIMNEVTQ